MAAQRRSQTEVRERECTLCLPPNNRRAGGVTRDPQLHCLHVIAFVIVQLIATLQSNPTTPAGHSTAPQRSSNIARFTCSLLHCSDSVGGDLARCLSPSVCDVRLPNRNRPD
ncbi:hypothetical protein P153DRAFT_70752 [Dothidotthia symphoricarpi CBS 119687]|uniref:Uncharacterized protein n=1 Tax=Dothidotthia symphoricarpi CBS 119687 TaxID=1392245 RepID=A0A6A6A5J9_9PLEO|nr:uncharacterized protein P153DRAFT_70752 [Dothidotthia symphoricarpi CBS 119687]KAF2126816.1 hypothetical protein P153DRAFT_70752 [Dothidotthia symphoricarpi CBS 119687]